MIEALLFSKFLNFSALFIKLDSAAWARDLLKSKLSFEFIISVVETTFTSDIGYNNINMV